MKTKENGENIYKILNAWLSNCRSILAFMKREIKYTKRERDRRKNAWGAVGQFLIIFFMNNKRPSHTLKGGSTIFFITFAKKFIIQITWMRFSVIDTHLLIMIIVGRGVLPPLFYEDSPPLYCLPTLPPFFEIFSIPRCLPCCLEPPAPLLIMLSCFFGWMGDCATFGVLFYLMRSWMYPCRALGPWCVFYATRCQVYWGLTHVAFCWYSDLISQTQTHTQTHTAYSGASRLTHPYKYIFSPTVMCSQQPSLLHWMNNSLISKIYFPQCLFFSKIIHLQKSYLLIRCYKTRFFLWNIKTDMV